MSEQFGHQQVKIDETTEKNQNDQKGENDENIRQGCSGLLRRGQRVP